MTKPNHVSTQYAALVARDSQGNESYADTFNGATVAPAVSFWDTTDLDAGESANNAANLIYPAIPYQSHVITGIWWSYDAGGTLAGGVLQVFDGNNLVLKVDITANGPGFLPFPNPKAGSAGTALEINLAAGGSGVTGRVGVNSHFTIDVTAFLDFASPNTTQYIPILF